MAPRCTTLSCDSQTLKDDAASKTIGNVNVPPRNTKEVLVPSPKVERMTQVMGNWERMIERQTQDVEIQA